MDSRAHKSKTGGLNPNKSQPSTKLGGSSQPSSKLGSSSQKLSPYVSSSSSKSQCPVQQRNQTSSSSSTHRGSSLKEDTGIDEKKRIIVLPDGFHTHKKLTLTPAAGEPYSCDGCKERGFGRSYRCQNTNCSYILHEQCANAVLQRENPKTHPFFGAKKFNFLAVPEGRPWICDACRMEVHGFVYHHREPSKDLDDTGFDLHPCCLKLRDHISYGGNSGAVTRKASLTLQRDVPKKCVICKHHKVKGDSRVGGWSYLTSDEDYCFHVSCFKKLFLEKIQENYFLEKNVTVVKKMQINAVEKKKGGLSNSKGSSSSVVAKREMGMVANIVSVVLKVIFATIFGDPVSFVLALVEALATLINNL
ncbi:hypothetical protein PIB30_002831 [Stylosanthes scabra]|uniref:DC1 domain-containing protein n=1 Tax=Stylosanthes scabra TaxID=79078 RepID=A0ABU6T3C1_9FABA|nr:hypothetical protein [Stylosanthes scabra]